MNIKGVYILAVCCTTFPVMAASFDCNQAHLPDEKAVCASRQLSDMDVELSVKYHFLHGLYAMGAAGDLQDAQEAWLIRRRQCQADSRCLTEVYQQRLQELDGLYEAIRKPL